MRVAIQGEAGSFSHEAAKRMVQGCSIVPCARSAEVFDRIERGSVNAAVIPIENSLAGSVAEHFDPTIEGTAPAGQPLPEIVLSTEHDLRTTTLPLLE